MPDVLDVPDVPDVLDVVAPPSLERSTMSVPLPSSAITAPAAIANEPMNMNQNPMPLSPSVVIQASMMPAAAMPQVPLIWLTE
ncbi:unannotated protein [freshwater metagenome]|uniref:Unannotated protein n=1 Tax=freshwater metagenome TaxID=449393 RepID=A0A6J6G0X6_9ZZZZ